MNGGTVAIVCVNYGSSALIESNLSALGYDDDITVIVVDNYSDATERHRVQDLACRFQWELVTPDTNEGFGVGVNLGVERAADLGQAVIVAVNPDVSIEPAAVRGLAERVRTAGTPTLVAPRILRPDGTVWFDGSDLYLADGRIRGRHRRPDEAGEQVQAWLSGAVLAMSVDSWRQVGGFDPEYFLYWEDVDLSCRVVRAGGQLVLANDLVAVHAEGGTQSDEGGLTSVGQAKSATYYYFNIRNRLLFAAKHLNRASWRNWLWSTPTVSWEILLQGGRRQFLSSMAAPVACARGVRDGLRLGLRLRAARGRAGR